MTRESLQKTAFYKGGAVHKVLKRYDFSDNEKKIIEAAIFTAKQDIPNMALIEKADALLKMVASSREPIKQEEEIDHKGIAKAVAQTNMKKYKAPQSAWTKPIEPRSSYSLHYRILAGVLVAGVLTYAMKHHGLYTYEEAVEKCSEKNQVLPLTMNDFMDSGYTFNQPAEFWTANGTLMVSQMWIAQQPDPENKGYSYICVDKNGKKQTRY